MTRHLDLDALATLIAVVDTGGFTAAANRLGRTQSAVSAKIATLEAELGHRLLDRGRGGAAPTEMGSVLLGYARRLLQVEDEARLALGGESLQGRVRLGMPDDYVEPFGALLLNRFVAAHPRVQLEVRCDISQRLERELAQAAIDVAVITRDPARPTGELLRYEPLVWCAPPDHRPELSDPLPLALFSEGCRFRNVILSALESVERPWRIAYASSSLHGLLSAVNAGFAVTCVAESSMPAGWRRLGAAEGLPSLPPAEIGLLVRPDAGVASRTLASAIRSALSRLDQAA
ncbi:MULTISPECIES: LysR substrate-binding domain-containing protein [Methylopila]|uniref:LysR family transcriptional regulator n=2 Tax=Methylopila TaxID=61653 RepID=A0A9W6N6H4_9HYPH|nr:LysR substrate-binding domain-containing protein [Methylopila turkensis]GLK79390.1 LysR family transcriptional regulator [Methylopila turkensis]